MNSCIFIMFKCYRSKNVISFQNATLEFLVEFVGCRWETHSEAFGIRSSGTEEYNTWSSKHQSADCRFPFKVRQDTMESPFPKEERSSYLHCCVWILWGRNYWASVPILSKYRWLQHWQCLAESLKIKPQMPGSTTVHEKIYKTGEAQILSEAIIAFIYMGEVLEDLWPGSSSS